MPLFIKKKVDIMPKGKFRFMAAKANAAGEYL